MSKVYNNPKDNAAFDRCIDVITKLLQKYGKQVLEQQDKNIPVSTPIQTKDEENGHLDTAA